MEINKRKIPGKDCVDCPCDLKTSCVLNMWSWTPSNFLKPVECPHASGLKSVAEGKRGYLVFVPTIYNPVMEVCEEDD